MIVPVKSILSLSDEETSRYIDDLLYIAKSDLFTNLKGYYQKLIDNLYNAGYYKVNESVIPLLTEKNNARS